MLLIHFWYALIFSTENLKPCDNLQLENGSFTPLKTEYKRRFINYFERFGDLYKQVSVINIIK